MLVVNQEIYKPAFPIKLQWEDTAEIYESIEHLCSNLEEFDEPLKSYSAIDATGRQVQIVVYLLDVKILRVTHSREHRYVEYLFEQGPISKIYVEYENDNAVRAAVHERAGKMSTLPKAWDSVANLMIPVNGREQEVSFEDFSAAFSS